MLVEIGSLFLLLPCRQLLLAETAGPATDLYAVRVDGELLIDACPVWNTSQVWSDYGYWSYLGYETLV